MENLKQWKKKLISLSLISQKMIQILLMSQTRKKSPEEPDEREEFGLEAKTRPVAIEHTTISKTLRKISLLHLIILIIPRHSMFEEYLLKNLALYFDKFEGELSTTPEEPEAAQDAQPDEPGCAPAPEEGEPETDIPDFELEKGRNDLESLIDKLLEQ